jgi:hypothetical protein
VSIDDIASPRSGQTGSATTGIAMLFRSVTTPAERRIFALVLVLALAVAIALPFSGYSIVWTSTLPSLGAAFMLFAVAVVYRTVRPNARIAAMCTGTAALLLFSMFTALLNYFAVRLDRPMIDATLAGWDRALGIDWPAMIAAVQAMPWVKVTLSIAYVTTLPQIAVVVVVLALANRLERLSHFMLAFCLAALLTVAFWSVFPSYGAFAYFWQADPTLSPQSRRDRHPLNSRLDGPDRFSFVSHRDRCAGDVVPLAGALCRCRRACSQFPGRALGPDRWRPPCRRCAGGNACRAGGHASRATLAAPRIGVECEPVL